MKSISPEKRKEFNEGKEFLKKHPLREINREPKKFGQIFRDEELESKYPYIDAYRDLELKQSMTSGKFAAGIIKPNDDRRLIADTIIRLAGCHALEMKITTVIDLYPQLHDGEPIDIFVRSDGPCQDALKIIRQQYPQLVVRK